MPERGCKYQVGFPHFVYKVEFQCILEWFMETGCQEGLPQNPIPNWSVIKMNCNSGMIRIFQSPMVILWMILWNLGYWHLLKRISASVSASFLNSCQSSYKISSFGFSSRTQINICQDEGVAPHWPAPACGPVGEQETRSR